MTATAPDLIEPFVGWRVWRTRVGVDRVWLRSMYFEQEWPGRRPAFADCSEDRAHVAPETEGCKCGLHAARTLAGASCYLPERLRGFRENEPVPTVATTNLVFGQVKLWGRVIEHDLGWRAQYAYPLRLYVPATYKGAEGLEARQARVLLADLYDVDVEIVRRADLVEA